MLLLGPGREFVGVLGGPMDERGSPMDLAMMLPSRPRLGFILLRKGGFSQSQGAFSLGQALSARHPCIAPELWAIGAHTREVGTSVLIRIGPKVPFRRQTRTAPWVEQQVAWDGVSAVRVFS